MDHSPLVNLLQKALLAREDLFDQPHLTAFRLFNGFYEGDPDLAVDLFARSLVIHDYKKDSELPMEYAQKIASFYQEKLPWLQAALLKSHLHQKADQPESWLLFGNQLNRKVRESGIWYAIDLMINQDTSLYLDTRNLRRWAVENLSGKTVLNTFAYTGSLGVAAVAGGARRVVQVDRNRQYLNLAKDSYSLNGFPISRSDFISADFWHVASRMRKSDERYDCVFLDPPFFASSSAGTVDLNRDSQRLINKVRPLVADGGYLVAVNNAIFVSGKDFLASLKALAQDDYLFIDELIPVPPDFTGYPSTRQRLPLVDPAPFNHSTKIAVLRMRRK